MLAARDLQKENKEDKEKSTKQEYSLRKSKTVDVLLREASPGSSAASEDEKAVGFLKYRSNSSSYDDDDEEEVSLTKKYLNLPSSDRNKRKKSSNSRDKFTTHIIRQEFLKERKREIARARSQNKIINDKMTLTIYPPHLQRIQNLLYYLCRQKERLDTFKPEEDTLIDELNALMDQIASEYLNELVKGNEKNEEYLRYLEGIVQKGREMINTIKERGASQVDMLKKIDGFIEAAQRNRNQFWSKAGQIIEMLVFVALGAVLGGFLGYAIGHLFFTYFTATATSAGFSTGASLGLILGKGGVGMGTVVAANLSIWLKFSIFYKETPIEMLCGKVAQAATNVANKTLR